MKRLFAWILCLLMLAQVAAADLSGEADSLAGKILTGQMEKSGATTRQEWVDALDVGAEWYVIALSRAHFSPANSP